MYKHQFIMDADALIKLAKASIIEEICKSFNCSITPEIYTETVTQGKEGLHQDAYKIDELTKRKLLKIHTRQSKELQINRDMGEGEKSIFRIYKSSKNMTIVTDDNMFIAFLREEKADWIIPASFISLLKSLGKLDAKQAMSHLNKMQPYIKPEVYVRIKNNIGGKNDINTTRKIT